MYTAYEEIRQPLCSLGENPLWCAASQEFFWTDIVNGTLYAWNPVSKTVPRLVLKTGFQTGAFLFTSTWDIVLFTEKGVFLCSPLPRSKSLCYSSDFKLLWNVFFGPGERFNDAICDPYGQILAGTKTEENKNGFLYRYSAEHSPEILLSGLNISNGMGFSPDGKIFYHVDSGTGTLTAYQYGKRKSLKPLRTLFQSNDLHSVPDGMTVDSAGNIWFAQWGGSRICMLSPQGKILRQISLPAIQVSSVAFGGSQWRQLFITSAAIGGVPDSGYTESGLFLGGHSYMLSSETPGKPEFTSVISS